jgi:hypothetical protein
MVAEPLLRQEIAAELIVDAQAAQAALRTGVSAKLRGLRRSAGVSLAWASDHWQSARGRGAAFGRDGGQHVHFQPGINHVPDMLTKPLLRVAFEKHRAALGLRPRR